MRRDGQSAEKIRVFRLPSIERDYVVFRFPFFFVSFRFALTHTPPAHRHAHPI
jgi:hypothetical protein